MLRVTTLAALIFSVFILFADNVSAVSNSNLIAEINQFRTSKGVGPVRTNSQTCSFAKLRVLEISTDFSHSGFYTRIQNNTIPYGKYSLITENLAWAPGGRNPVDMWINSPSHAANMLKKTPFVCVAQHGDYFAYEGLII